MRLRTTHRHDDRPPAPPTPLPVVLVQGLACHAAALAPLAARIERRLHRPTHCLTSGLGFGDIRDTALDLLEAVERMASKGPFARFDVVGHSMGGLVAAYLLKCLDQGRRVRRVVTLGAPFGGVPGARLGGLLGPFGRSLSQIAPGSPLLRLLGSVPVPPGSAIVAITGSRDRIVSAVASRLPELAGHHWLDAGACDHHHLLFGTRGFARVAHALTHPDLEACAGAGTDGTALSPTAA